jgi:phage-related baseplate assembly protein
MDTAHTDYLASLTFPKIIHESTVEECLQDYRQDYNLILSSIMPTLTPLAEKPQPNQYLIEALLQSLAERESLLRHDINKMLHCLLPSPQHDQKASQGAKGHYLDEVIQLFGMERKKIHDVNAEQAIAENDESIIQRLDSRLESLNNAGTEHYYRHNLLSLDPSIHDIWIKQENSGTGKLKLYLLAKPLEEKPQENMLSEKQQKTWLAQIEKLAKENDIIPVADTIELIPATLIPYQLTIIKNHPDNKEQSTKLKQIVKQYSLKKYKFNTVVSISELSIYLEDSLLENSTITLQLADKNGAYIAVDKIETKEGEVAYLMTMNVHARNDGECSRSQ